MTVYDAAHELARGLAGSEEYKAFLAAKKSIETDAAAKKMVKEFLNKQMELEYARLSGKPEDKGQMEQLQKMLELLSYNSRAKDFIQAHVRFQRILADIYKIIGDSVAEGLDIFAKE